MYKKTIYYLLFSGVTSLCCTTGLTAQETPQIWKKYIGEINDSEVPDLPNYSYAGYKLGEEAIPVSNAPVYDVTDYGAIANDDLSDVDAVKAAITAAENSGGGVVFFPKGEFIVNATAGNDASIVIGGSHIVLKGSGSGQGGTVITMQNV